MNDFFKTVAAYVVAGIIVELLIAQFFGGKGKMGGINFNNILASGGGN